MSLRLVAIRCGGRCRRSRRNDRASTVTRRRNHDAASTTTLYTAGLIAVRAAYASLGPCAMSHGGDDLRKRRPQIDPEGRNLLHGEFGLHAQLPISVIRLSK